MKWLTFLGESVYASINCIYLAKINGFIFDEFIYIKNRNVKKQNIDLFEKEIKILFPNSKITATDIEETDFTEIKNFIEKTLEYSKENNNEICIDITPGRKYMSALLLSIGLKKNCNYIFYLHLNEKKYEQKRYDEIPLEYCKLYNLSNNEEIKNIIKINLDKEILNRNQLMLLINKLIYEKKENINISYFNIPLFSIQKDLTYNQIKDFKNFEVYQKPEKENFSFQDILLALKCSLIYPIQDFESEADLIKKDLQPDIFRGEPINILFFDSCALRERLNERIFSISNEINLPIFISKGIEKELKVDDLYIDEKYKQEEINENFKFLLNNQPLEQRKRYIGLIEFNKLKQKKYATPLISKTKDINIIDKLEIYQNYQKAKVIAFTLDNNFTAEARKKNIKTYFFKYEQYKYFIEKINKISFEQLRDLIFFSAIIFGKIKVNNFNIYGVFQGKNINNWYNEEIKISH